jgi:thiamine-phosphate pyrophosphorylase
MLPGDRIPPRWPKTAALSLKCHSYDEMRSTPKGCHYLFLSPIFPSVSKRDYVPQRTHREFQVIVERWRAEGGCPVYGLGGITPQNAAHVRALGFDGMAFIGSVWESAQPVQAFLELERAWSGKDARKLKRKH